MATPSSPVTPAQPQPIVPPLGPYTTSRSHTVTLSPITFETKEETTSSHVPVAMPCGCHDKHKHEDNDAGDLLGDLFDMVAEYGPMILAQLQNLGARVAPPRTDAPSTDAPSTDAPEDHPVGSGG